jgi:UDP-N-acetylmuramoylalanine--D-glutamate ligase
MHDLTGQHLAILGAGRSGLGAARLARLQGARVTVFDESEPTNLGTALERLRAESFEVVAGAAARERKPRDGEFSEAVLSPGLDTGWPLPQRFAAAGTPLTGEMEFGFRANTTPLIAITGTNGKSTCTELTAALLNGCGLKSLPCGNHGIPLSEVVASGGAHDVLALEVSSFQLETIERFHPRVAVWLNFAPDHLDRYPDLASYFAAKSRIFENLTADDLAVVRAGESVSSGAARRISFSATGAPADWTWSGGVIRLRGTEVGRTDRIRLRGRHNLENLLAALAACHEFGLSVPDMLEAAAAYTPPAHRCELVRGWRGREFINDSKATNLHALEACLVSMDRPMVLIAGGKDKQLNYSPLAALLPGRVRALVLIGEIAAQLQADFGPLLPCETATDMTDAVQRAARLSQEGDLIILSPGTSSFDMFSGYAQRGETFRQATLALS